MPESTPFMPCFAPLITDYTHVSDTNPSSMPESTPLMPCFAPLITDYTHVRDTNPSSMPDFVSYRRPTSMSDHFYLHDSLSS